KESGSTLLGVGRPGIDRSHDLRILRHPASADVVMEYFGTFAEGSTIGEINLGQQGGIEPFILAIALPFHDLSREIHVDQAFVNLDDPILQSRGHIELASLGLKSQVCLNRFGNMNIEVDTQRAQGGGDNRAGTAQSKPLRYVGVVFNSK